MSNLSQDAILERIDGLKELTTSKFEENAEAHAMVIARLDHTNGDVSMLKKIVWGLGGGIAVLSFIALPVISSVLRMVENQQKATIGIAKIK
jgi:hypothetical protein